MLETPRIATRDQRKVTNYGDKMMVKIVDHLVQGLHIDIEKRKQEAAAKQRLETQLYKLLAELIDTERKYVRDLEKVKCKK